MVGEFVPEREVEIDAHENFGHHHDGHHTQAFPIVALDNVFQDGHVHHHGEERQQSEDNEVFHHLGLGLPVFFVALAAEDKRLVGVAEGLRNHRHDHRDFHAGAINAELHFAFLAGHDKTVANLVGHLVEDAR